ncbi:MAG: hypothetical protein ACKVN9_01305 [Methylophilaceae bacterium]
MKLWDDCSVYYFDVNFNMRNKKYLRTDEHEEAVRSLEWAELQARLILDDPYYWKWVLISLHNAAQGFMVLALWNGNGLLSLKPKVAKQWLEAYESDKPFPTEQLDKFLNLYAKVKDSSNFSYCGSAAFIPSSTHDESFKHLNEFRNEFIHFTPKGWSLQLLGLPKMALDVLDLIQFFGWEASSILWHKRTLPVRAKRSLKRLRRTLLSLQLEYSN